MVLPSATGVFRTVPGAIDGRREATGAAAATCLRTVIGPLGSAAPCPASRIRTPPTGGRPELEGARNPAPCLPGDYQQPPPRARAQVDQGLGSQERLRPRQP